MVNFILYVFYFNKNMKENNYTCNKARKCDLLWWWWGQQSMEAFPEVA